MFRTLPRMRGTMILSSAPIQDGVSNAQRWRKVSFEEVGSTGFSRRRIGCFGSRRIYLKAREVVHLHV